MDAVRAFNTELSSVYDSKPPISRAKMAILTKGAIKAIKFYKHVVLSVEKFIQKCRPEYKVPGLYVIDSIVRQSRHQFGPEKDVFAPRFTKNIVQTFQNLFKCPAEDKSKIMRVMSLWQKNNVFPPTVVQPLLDLAKDPHNSEVFNSAQRAIQTVTGLEPTQPKAHTEPKAEASHRALESGHRALESGHRAPQASSSASADNMQGDILRAVAQLLTQSQQQTQQLSLSAQQQQLQQLQLLQQQLMQQSQILAEPALAPPQQQPLIDGNLLAQIQALTNQLLTGGVGAKLSLGDLKPPEPEPQFNKKLLDFDYGESDEEDGGARDPGLSQQAAAASAANTGQPVGGNMQKLFTDPNIMSHLHQMSETIQKTEQLKTELSIQEERQRLLEQQHEEFSQQINQVNMPPLPRTEEPRGRDDMDIVVIDDDTDEDFGKRKRSRSRSRTPKRGRHGTHSQGKRRRSRSRDHHRKRSRSRDRELERERREKDRERRKKGLPPLKDGHVSICSATLWLGHLSKQTTEDDLGEELSKYGEVQSIYLVPPRGCAYVVFTWRKDASKALDRLRGAKLLGNTLKAAWAPSKGIKESKFKDQWDVDLGVTYIPWEQMPGDLSQLAEGGMVDDETLPDNLRESGEERGPDVAGLPMDQAPPTSDMSAMPAPIMPPLMGQPPMMHHGMMPMMPMHGMMPPPMMPMGMPPPMGVPPPMHGMMPPGHMGMGMGRMPPMPPMMMPAGVPPPVSVASQPPTSMSMGTTSTTPTPQGDLTPSQESQMAGRTPTTPSSQAMSVGSISLPSSSPGGSSLAQAIQNIVANSASIQAIAQTNTAGIRPPVSSAGGNPFNPGVPPPGFMGPPPGFDPSKPPPRLGGPGSHEEPRNARPSGYQPDNIPEQGRSLSEVVNSWASKIGQNPELETSRAGSEFHGSAAGPPSLLALNMSPAGLARPAMEAGITTGPMDSINSRMDRDSRPGREAMPRPSPGPDGVLNPMGDQDERILNGPRGPTTNIPGLGGLPHPSAPMGASIAGPRGPTGMGGPQLGPSGAPGGMGGPSGTPGGMIGPGSVPGSMGGPALGPGGAPGVMGPRMVQGLVSQGSSTIGQTLISLAQGPPLQRGPMMQRFPGQVVATNMGPRMQVGLGMQGPGGSMQGPGGMQGQQMMRFGGPGPNGHNGPGPNPGFQPRSSNQIQSLLAGLAGMRQPNMNMRQAGPGGPFVERAGPGQGIFGPRINFRLGAAGNFNRMGSPLAAAAFNQREEPRGLPPLWQQDVDAERDRSRDREHGREDRGRDWENDRGDRERGSSRDRGERDRDREMERSDRERDRERNERERNERERGERDRSDRERGDRERSDRERGDRERSDRERSDRERSDRERSDRDRDRSGGRDRERRSGRDGDRRSRWSSGDKPATKPTESKPDSAGLSVTEKPKIPETPSNEPKIADTPKVSQDTSQPSVVKSVPTNSIADTPVEPVVAPVVDTPQGAPSQEAPAKPKEAPHKDAPPKPKEALHKEVPSKETPPKEAPPKEAPPKEAPPKEAPKPVEIIPDHSPSQDLLPPPPAVSDTLVSAISESEPNLFVSNPNPLADVPNDIPCQPEPAFLPPPVVVQPIYESEPALEMPVPEPAREVPEPARKVPEPAPEVPEPAREVPEPAQEVPEPAREVPEPAFTAPDPVLLAEQDPEPATEPARLPTADISSKLDTEPAPEQSDITNGATANGVAEAETAVV